MAYFWWGLATFVVAALILLVAYATKAGRNAQAVNQSAQNTAQAKALTTITAAMAQAQATGPPKYRPIAKPPRCQRCVKWPHIWPCGVRQ